MDEQNPPQKPKAEWAVPPQKIKEWNYAESKDLSMNIGGLFHDAAQLFAIMGFDHLDIPNKEAAEKVADLTYELYLAKEELINKIKKQTWK